MTAQEASTFVALSAETVPQYQGLSPKSEEKGPNYILRQQ
jgi:hypothetical protein